MPFLTFFSGSFAVQNGDHLRSGIICGTVWGSFAVLVSFAVQFGDHLRFWDHLRSWDHLRTRTELPMPTHFLTIKLILKENSSHFNGQNKGEVLRILRINSWKAKFDEHMALFKQRLQHRVNQITFWKWPYLKSISAKECRLYKINKKRAKECCRLLQNTAQTYSYEQMASYTKPTLTTKNIQTPSSYFM